MRLFVALLGLALSATCFGQISTEEAQAKLAAKHADTQPVQELADLRQIIADLRKENSELRAQIATLNIELKNRPAATPKAASGKDLASTKFTGMTIDAANAAVRQSTDAQAQGARFFEFALVGTRDDVQVWQSKIFLPIAQPKIAPRSNAEGQALARSGYRFGGRSPAPVILVTIDVRDGKIEHSSIDRETE